MEPSAELMELLREIRNTQIELLSVAKAAEERGVKANDEWEKERERTKKRDDEWRKAKEKRESLDEEWLKFQVKRESDWQEAKSRYELDQTKWREGHNQYMRRMRWSTLIGFGFLALMTALMGIAFGIGRLSR